MLTIAAVMAMAVPVEVAAALTTEAPWSAVVFLAREVFPEIDVLELVQVEIDHFELYSGIFFHGVYERLFIPLHYGKSSSFPSHPG